MAPVLHIVGARPQFVKAAVVLEGTNPAVHHIVHTGNITIRGCPTSFSRNLTSPTTVQPRGG